MAQHLTAVAQALGPTKTARLAADTSAVPPLLNLKQAAALVGVSTRTFRAMLTEDWAPAPVELSPRVLRFVRDELLQAIADRAPRRSTREEPAQLAAARAASTRAA